MNHKRMIDLIDQNVSPSPSGAETGLHGCVSELAEFAELRTSLNQYMGLGDGWVARFPVGYEATPHQDAHNLVVYYPANHPSRLVIGDVPFDTTEGRFVIIPKGLPHQIEPVRGRPRYAVVWTLS